MDLIAIPGSQLCPNEIAADPNAQASRVRNLGVELSNLLILFGVGFQDRALNSPDPAVRLQNLQTFKRVLEFCVAADVYSITVLPGVEHKPHTKQTALEWTAAELNRLNALAKAAGVLLVYEPHVESILENPHEVLVFARNNTDVKLVCDYSHSVSLGYSVAELEPLVPYTGHVHLRQAAPGRIQTRWDEGTIDFAALVDLLQRTGYQGYLTLEYEHDTFWDMDKCDVMTETIKMRNAILPHLS